VQRVHDAAACSAGWLQRRALLIAALQELQSLAVKAAQMKGAKH
jgi:hypothetical protein